MNLFLLAASAASFFTFAVHTWVGGPVAARALLRSSDMHDVPKFTNYYCWHLVTITLFLMGVAFAWASIEPGGLDVAWFAFALSVSFLVWNLVLIVWKKQSFLYMPQWLLFLGISAIALPGMI